MELKLMIYCAFFSFLASYLLSSCLFNNADKIRVGKRAYSERVRLHRKGVPRLGGLVLCGAFYLTFLLLFILRRDVFRSYEMKFIGIFLASIVIVGCGLYDDLVSRLNYKTKFILQILAGVIIIIFGYRINILTNPFDGKIYIGILGIPIVIIWMLTVINSINLIDGLDGLACGITTIVCLSLCAIEFSKSNLFLSLIIITIIGANLAFLRYNFYPAKLFLGDSGSLFLGLMLGILAIESSTKRSASISLILPLLALFIPIGSVVFTFSRRIATAKNPFKPDRHHLHYRFIHAGISHRNTVLIYYAVCFVYAMLGTFCFFMPKKFELAIIILAIVGAGILYLWASHFIHIRVRLQRRKAAAK
ncbi:MAG: MraY family glycosyltransferase [Candidatus Omnitrophota bacterium]